MRRRSLYLNAPKAFVWADEKLPEVGPDEVLVESTAGAISLGSEVPRYLGLARGNGEPYPLTTGYENVAVVRECGGEVARVSPGDRVVASYGHRTHAVLREEKVFPVPERIPDSLALLAILSCDVTKGVRKLSPVAGERALVTGAGAIGLLAVFMLRACGVREVDVVEPEPGRRKLALKLGAGVAVSPAGHHGLPGFYEACLECSAQEEAFAIAQRAAATGGRLCILSDGNLEPLTLIPEFHEKELSVVGSSDGWDYREHANWFFKLATEERARCLAELFDLETSFEGLPVVFEKMAEGRWRPVKVLVRY